VPAHGRPSASGPREERAELPDGQRVLLQVVAQRPRLVRGVLEELVTDCVAKLVVVVGPVLDPAIVPALEPDDAQAGLRQLGGEDPADPADADDGDVCLLVRHLTSLPSTCCWTRSLASSRRSPPSSAPRRPAPPAARAGAA